MGLPLEGLEEVQSPPQIWLGALGALELPHPPWIPPPTRSPPSCPALFPCKSYRFQWCSQSCQSHVELGLCPQGLAHPTLPPLWARAGHPPHQHSPFHIPKSCWRRGRREDPAPRDPMEHMGLPVAKSWAGATLGWSLLSCRVGASLDPRQQVANSQTPTQTPPPPSSPPAPVRKGSMHHLPPSE